MNFTGEIKRELFRTFPQKACCQSALVAAAADTCGRLFREEDGRFSVSFTGESERGAAYLLRLIETRFGVRLTVTEAVRDPKHGKDKLTFSYTGEEEDPLMRAIRSPVTEPCCGQAYLKGAFLFGGSCTLPHEGKKTGYHLEVGFGGGGAAENFRDLLDEFQIIGNIVRRGESAVVYIKSRDAISDFLAIVGADLSLGRLEEVSAEREENNNRNRVENCTAGNADRAAIASAAQVVALTALKESEVFRFLPQPLRETAEARLKDPALSLAELARKMGIGKSCLNHRLRKLLRICEEI